MVKLLVLICLWITWVKRQANMVTAMEKLVKIERQAYNLDVPQDDEKPEAKLTEAQIDERIRRLASEASES